MNKELLIIAIGSWVIQFLALIVFLVSRISFTPSALVLTVNIILFGSINIALLIVFIFAFIKK